MPKYKFIGEDSRVFPTLSKELKNSDVFHSEVKILASFLEEVADDVKVTVKFDDAEKSAKSKQAKAEKVAEVVEVVEDTATDVAETK